MGVCKPLYTGMELKNEAGMWLFVNWLFPRLFLCGLDVCMWGRMVEIFGFVAWLLGASIKVI